jgi:hypothetical protein
MQYKTPEDQKKDIIKTVTDLFGAKYDKGQIEHGGHLWEKPVMGELVNEALDFLSYVFTMRYQLEQVKELLAQAASGKNPQAAQQALNILNSGNIAGKGLKD